MNHRNFRRLALAAALSFAATAAFAAPVTYTMERWKTNSVTLGGIDLRGAVSWSAKNRKVNIKVANISNLASSGKSGTLRLRLWAVKSKFAGNSMAIWRPSCSCSS